MASQEPVKGLIFDLGDVLFQWSRDTKTNVSPQLLEKILSSPFWYEYECGRLSRAMCYEQVALQFGIDASQIDKAFAQARASLQPDAAIVTFLKNLRKRLPIRIYAMSNVSKEDFASLADKMDSSLFDHVFTSASHGTRKPELDFYRQVLQQIDMKPEHVVFVDDKHENVLAAEEVGIRGLVFNNDTVKTLQHILYGPVTKGYDYLHLHRRRFDSVTDSEVFVGDNFANLLILEVTQDMYACLLNETLRHRSSI
jgi:HAD superfamily hydrolase (TIGR01509 family)